jgi:carbon starvation protein CstA
MLFLWRGILKILICRLVRIMALIAATLAFYFFQFVIMYRAVFILTAIETGTRLARYLIEDFFGM